MRWLCNTSNLGNTSYSALIIIYHYDEAGQLITVFDGSNVVKREYVYWGNQQIALINSGTIYYIHNDHLNTPQVITNQSQQVVWMGDYEPFGKVAANAGNSVEVFSRFPGQYLDSETGLYYNYFRDYDPSIGRYIESDPIGLGGGINTYLYVGGNPLMFIDFYGLLKSCDEKLLDCRVACRRQPHMSGFCFEKCEGQYGSSSNCKPEPEPNPEGEPKPEKNPEQKPSGKPASRTDSNGCLIEYEWRWGMWLPKTPVCPEQCPT